MASERAAEIAKSLTEAQRTYVLNKGRGYYTTGTVRALRRRGIERLRGIEGLNDLGEAVRRILQSKDTGHG